jgi:DNA mismatch repair protein MutS
MIRAGDEARLLTAGAADGFYRNQVRWKLMISPDGSARTAAPPFHSILFDGGERAVAESVNEPDFFADLRLDQVVASLTAGREEYDLTSLFHRPLHEVEAVQYRHHVLRDLEQEPVLEVVRKFARAMQQMRGHLELATTLRYPRQQQRWFLEAGSVYCRTVRALCEGLDALELRSRGFLSLCAYLGDYVESEAFTGFAQDTRAVEDDLAAVRYTVHLRGNRVRVSRFEGEADMSSEIERTFEKFKQGAVDDHRRRFREPPDMNHVEAKILDLVAQLHPETFARLEQFCARHARYLDDTVGRFDREIQFYVAYLEYIEPLKKRGLEFSLPRVSTRSKDIAASGTFDLALAAKLAGDCATKAPLSGAADHSQIVGNDLHLTDPERILVVSGPNNGGKTTFARTFGQLHYLASLGLPVPGVHVRLFLPDRIFTHFEREEEIQTMRGKFEDELHRIHDILERATSASVLVMNESFSSTTLRDAVLVGSEVVKQIINLDALCVFVTFVDELSTLGPSTVSMMSTVVPEDPAVRTYKIVRKAADGLAYAAAIAEKYGLTYETLRRRVVR